MKVRNKETSMNYTKGEFQHFRAITKIHLGAICDNLYEGEEVMTPPAEVKSAVSKRLTALQRPQVLFCLIICISYC